MCYRNGKCHGSCVPWPPPVDSPQTFDRVRPVLLPESTTTYTWHHHMAGSQLSYWALDFEQLEAKCGVKFLKPTVSVTAAPVGRSGIQLTLDLDAAAHPQLSGKHLAAIETSSG